MVDIQVRIVNKNGVDVAMDGKEIGEIIVKGKGVANNVLGQGTADGWIYTGDLGTMDSEGKVHVVKSHYDITEDNHPVSAIDIETILIDHPAIQEVSVIPKPDAELGEVAHAFVVVEAPIAKQELIAYVDQHSSSHVPRIDITFLNELPKTASGKILKKLLEDL